MTIVYYESSHFISKIINKLGDIWYNDGYENGESVPYMGNMINISLKEPLKVKKFLVAVLIHTKFEYNMK